MSAVSTESHLAGYLVSSKVVLWGAMMVQKKEHYLAVWKVESKGK